MKSFQDRIAFLTAQSLRRASIAHNQKMGECIADGHIGNSRVGVALALAVEPSLDEFLMLALSAYDVASGRLGARKKTLRAALHAGIAQICDLVSKIEDHKMIDYGANRIPVYKRLIEDNKRRLAAAADQHFGGLASGAPVPLPDRRPIIWLLIGMAGTLLIAIVSDLTGR